MRQEVINEVFIYLLDHYWDSLESERHILELHLKACKEQLEDGKTSTSYQQKSTATGDEDNENTVAFEKQSGHL